MVNRRPLAARALTLIELLVVIAIIGLLIAIGVPSLAAARESGRSAACLSNLRQAFAACRAYADDNRGYGPAIGEPYAAIPNWGLVVQRYAGEDGRDPNELFKTRSVLVCPSARQRYATAMTRTYAMNATGHAGRGGDLGSFDDPNQPAHIRLDRIAASPLIPILLDSAIAAPPTGGAPPPERTASVIDFRDPAHVQRRVGWHHKAGRVINHVGPDGATDSVRSIPDAWATPLP